MTVTRFALPTGSDATEPPEARGLARDQVRLLVARPAGVQHVRFTDLPDQLDPGDLVVVNTSATVPAALDAALPGGRSVAVHVAGPGTGGSWIVELRRVDATGPDPAARRGLRLDLPGGVRLELDEPYPASASASVPAAALGKEWSRLWRAVVSPRCRCTPT